MSKSIFETDNVPPLPEGLHYSDLVDDESADLIEKYMEEGGPKDIPPNAFVEGFAMGRAYLDRHDVIVGNYALALSGFIYLAVALDRGESALLSVVNYSHVGLQNFLIKEAANAAKV